MKNKNSGKKPDKTYQLISLTAYTLFLYGVGVLLTLYIQDAYFDTLEAKASCFRFLMYVLLPLLVLLIVWKIKDKKLRIHNNFLLTGLLFLALISLLSTALSDYKEYAFSGEAGWHIGAFCICSLVLAVLVFAGIEIKEKVIYLPLMGVVLFEFILIILGGTKLNLFSFRTWIQGEDYYSFYGTLGNSNWIVGYLSLTVPAFLCLYLQEDNRTKEGFYCVCCLTGLIASVINGADGIYPAYLFCFFLLIPYLFRDLSRIRKTAVLMIGFSAVLLIIRMCGFFDARIRRMNVLGPYLFRAAPILLVTGLLLILVARKQNDEKYIGIRNKVIIAIETVSILSAIAATIYLLVHSGKELSNGRIELWQYSFARYFHDYSRKEKLLGVGPELLITVYQEIDAGEKVFASSHSEPVQMLMSMGVLGLVSWIICWASVFLSFVKTKAYEKRNALAVYSGLFAYFAQSFVNSATTLNVCVLTVFVILLTQLTDSEEFTLSVPERKEKKRQNIDGSMI